MVDGLGQTIHERLFAIEVEQGAEPILREPSFLGDFTPAEVPGILPEVIMAPETISWLHEYALLPFLNEARNERISEIERIATHVELSLTELLNRADEEIGKAATDIEQKRHGAEGRLAQAENRHAELLNRRERRRQELERQQAVSLQAVERITSVLVLPHPERETPEVKQLRQNLETEAIAMQVVIKHEETLGRQVTDVHKKNLGYDITSLDFSSGELRLIEIKGLSAVTGTILLTPNERRVAEDRPDCYWLYIVTDCGSNPKLQPPILNPAQFNWNEVNKVAHYYLSVNALTQPMKVCEESPVYGDKK